MTEMSNRQKLAESAASIEAAGKVPRPPTEAETEPVEEREQTHHARAVAIERRSPSRFSQALTWFISRGVSYLLLLACGLGMIVAAMTDYLGFSAAMFGFLIVVFIQPLRRDEYDNWSFDTPTLCRFRGWSIWKLIFIWHWWFGWSIYVDVLPKW